MEAALWSAIAIVAAVSTGTVFVLLGRIDGLTSRVAARLDGLATRVDGLTTEIGTQATAGSVRIDGLASEMRGRFDRADDRFDRIDERLSRVERELRRHVGRHAG